MGVDLGLRTRLTNVILTFLSIFLLIGLRSRLSVDLIFLIFLIFVILRLRRGVFEFNRCNIINFIVIIVFKRGFKTNYNCVFIPVFNGKDFKVDFYIF